MRVLTELETMRRVAEGNLSLSRMGRCELRIMQGHSGLAQGPHPTLRRALHMVLRKPLSGLLVCVPRIFDAMPPGKALWYQEFLGFDFPDRTYGSTFVSRRDAWVGMEDKAAYWAIVRRIWQDRPVLLVHGSEKGLQARDSGMLGNAASIQVLQSMRCDAWADRDRLIDECLRWAEIARQQSPLVCMCLGATATVLAFDLTRLGIQALDIGHMASSWEGTGKQARMAAA